MGTVADKLARLQETKRAIRGALEEKGQPVADGDSFASYAEKLRAIDTSEDARPAEWLPLPDISNAQTETIVMLFQIPPTGISQIGVYFDYEGDYNNLPQIRVDWGDGSIDEPSPSGTFIDYDYLWHRYDYDSMDAPMTKEGEKQVIVRFENTSAVPFVGTFHMDNEFAIKEEGKYRTEYNHPTLLKDMKLACPVQNDNFQISFFAPVCLWGLEVYNLRRVALVSAYGLKHFRAVGENYIEHSIAGAYQCRKMDIPDNVYKTFSVSSSLLSEVNIDASAISSIGVSSMNNLRRMRLRGCKKLINISYSKMDREAFIELFESLGAVTTATSLKVTSSSGYSELTDEDKAIARNKGWTLT